MARLDIEGLAELNDAFRRISDIPERVTDEALQAMAAVAAKRIRAQGEAMGVWDPKSDVHILDKITVGKSKMTAAGGYVDINFSGSRTRGKEKQRKTRNDDIAFVNEYGRRGQAARPFIGAAMGQDAAIAAPGLKIVGDWIEKEWES